jgi:hypothetical protein
MRLFALLLCLPSAAAAQERPWTVGVEGGVSRLGPDFSQPFTSLSLARSFGPVYARAGVAWFGGDEGADRFRTGVDTTQFSLALGYAGERVGVELHGAIGERSFEDLQLAGPNGQAIRIGGDGDIRSIGGSVTYLVPLSDRLALTPFATLDYSALDTVRTATGPNGQPLAGRVDEADGVTGAAGLAIDRAIGALSSLGAQASFVTTSNTAAVTRTGRGTSQRLLEGTGVSDSWAELDLNATLGLNEALAIDLSVSQSLGLSPSEATTGAVALRLSF